MTALFLAFRVRVRTALNKLDLSLSRVEEHQLAQQRTIEENLRVSQESLRLLREIHGDYYEFKDKTERRIAALERPERPQH
jgi:hypothetical protein